MNRALPARRRFDVPCAVEIENSADSLHAHVRLMDDIDLNPGDRVLVHEAIDRIAFGERTVVRRRATIVRANRIERLWERIKSYFGLAELFEVSFTSRRTL